MKGFIRDIKTFMNIILQLKSLLTLKQQVHAVGVFLLILIGAILEALGVAAILPFISAIMSPSILWNNEYILKIAAMFSINNDTQLIIFLGIAISGVYIFKNLFLILVSFIEARFRYNFVYEVSKLMLYSYMKRPYVYFLNTNSAEMMRGVNDDINNVSDMMAAVFKICSVCLMIVGIGMFLFLQDPVMAVGILMLAIVIFILMIFTIKRETKRLGSLKIKLAREAYKYAYQAINGIKEITIMKREDYFIKSYTNVTVKKKEADTIYTCISACPERVMEAVFLTGVLMLICIQVYTGNMSASFISSLAAFAVGAMRILPSLSTLTTRMTQLIYFRPALEGICNNVNQAREQELEIKRLEQTGKVSDLNVKFEKNITVEKISWKYPNSDNYILKDATMDIQNGDSIALVGKSGAGKTTLADLLLGLLRPESGRILMDGIDIFKIPHTWCKIIGYVPQMVYLIDDTVRNNVSFGISEEQIEDEKIWKALEKAQIKEFIESLPQKLDTIIGERGIKFSGGQRQRIAIARALYHDPQILVFDEATAALDGETEETVMQAIDSLQGSKTLIIIAHRLNTIRHCTRFFEIEEQKIVEKRREEILA